MNKISISFVSDIIFVAGGTFLLLLALSGYFLLYPYTIIFSASLSLLFTLAAVKIFSVKRNKKFTSAEQEREYFNTMTLLNFMTKTETFNLFFALAEKKGVSIEKKKNFYFVPEKNAVLFFFFGYEGAQKKDVVKAFNYLSDEKTAVLVGESFLPEVKEFAERFNGKIKLVCGREVYSELKENDLLPQGKAPLTELNEQKEKPNIKFNLLNKKRAKNYLVFGVAFLLFSYFVPIKLYYVICGGIMLILALVVRLFGKTDG